MKTCTFNPKTHKVVPIESTSKMDQAGEKVLESAGERKEAVPCWDAMIAAAPEYPADAGWTLCSDGLPEDDEKVLICTDSGEISVGSFDSQSYDGCWSIGNPSMAWDHDFNLGVTVEKWMPLPPAPEAPC